MKLAFLVLSAAAQLANCWPVQVADLSYAIRFILYYQIYPMLSDHLVVLCEVLQ